MSAPQTDLPPSFISSSGHVDGLGRRLLTFNRESGAMMERLHLRPELSAFESAIRQRLELLAAFEDDRFARPYQVERNTETGELTVLSEFIAGSRLSDLLEAAQDTGLVPGVDVALGFLLDALPALSVFHKTTGSAHGLIDPTRIVIATGGQMVFLDCAFGAVVERLGLSRSRLWTELGLASAPPPARVSLDVPADIAQLALCGVMLVLGRRLREEEYPDALPSLLMEVVDVAQIRGSHLFASGLQRLFQRSLPLQGRRPFSAAIEALEEVRQLLRREIGLTVCHQALVDFVQQMDAAISTRNGDGEEELFADEDELFQGAEPEPSRKRLGSIVLDTAALESIEVVDEFEGSDSDFAEEPDDSLELDVSLDVSLDVTEPDLPPAERAQAQSALAATSEPAVEPSTPVATAEPQLSPSADSESPAPMESNGQQTPQTTEESGSWRRRKRHQHKSARARKDKLRSTTAPSTPPAPPPAPAATEAAKPTPSGWIVSPDRAAKFEPAVAESARPSTTPAVGHPIVPRPPQSVYATATAAPPLEPVAAPPQPVVPVVPPQHKPVPMPVFGVPPTPPPAAPPVPTAQAPIQTVPLKTAPGELPQSVQRPTSAPLRVKAEPPPGYAPPRNRDVMAGPPHLQRPSQGEVEQPRAFPWKLAAAVVLIVGGAIVAGRYYMLSNDAPPEDRTAIDVPAPVPAPAAPPAATGEIAIETQPAGARVLLDGKPVGESPLKLTGIPAGRHVVTFVSSSGEVTKTVRVAAGKTVSMDVPIFSGWVAIFAPIVVEISENGRALGTTELERVMLSPGRHELTFVNRDLGYKAVQEVDVEPGEVRSITLEPKGTVNFNAVPWAEVWFEGQKLGDTPLANMRVALGVREFVFKHPQFGERTVSATVRGDEPVAVSVDFTRQP
jgi:hypothetical protein